MKKLFQRNKAAHEKKTSKGKVTLGMLGGTGAIAALAPAAGAAPLTFTDGITVTPTDVVSTGFNFMGMFDGFTMLVAGLIIAPVAVGMLIWLLKKAPKKG